MKKTFNQIHFDKAFWWIRIKNKGNKGQVQLIIPVQFSPKMKLI
jgi:hypothetical protein